MVGFLAKRMLGENASPEREREVYGTVCGGVGIGANLLLCLFKIIAGLISGSVAVLADGLNNLSDAGSSVVTLLGFRLAGKKPDRDHPFGHGRIEYLTGLAVAVMVILLGVELGKSSIEQLIEPTTVSQGLVALIVMGCAIPAKLALFFMNRRYGKRFSSGALLATATDCLTDACASGITLLSLLLSSIVPLPLDGICGLVLAGLIVVSGVKVALDTVNPLLGQAPDPAFVQSIADIVKESDMVLGIHDLIVHDYGPGRRMVSLHAEVSADSDLNETHDAIDNLEAALMERLGCHAVIHMDPIVANDEKVTQIRGELAGFAVLIDPAISIHDLRMVQGPTHTNLVFDLVIPYRLDAQKREIEDRMRLYICEKYPDHRAVMKVEHSFVGEEEKGS